MLIRKPDDIISSEVTPESVYINRRQFMTAAGGAAAAVAATGSLRQLLAGARAQDEKPSSYEDITTYNNFYEFGTDKDDPAQNATRFRTRPWTVQVGGLVKKPADYAF